MDSKVLDQFIKSFIKAMVRDVSLLDEETMEELIRLAKEEAKKQGITE